jgi:hypothetical protein
MAYVTTTQFNTQLQKIGEKTLYSGNGISLDVENLKKVTGNLEKFNFVDFMNTLSYKKAEVKLNSSLGTLVYEAGTVITGGQTLSATVTKGTSAITKIEFFKNGTLVSTIEDGVADGGNFTYASGYDIATNENYSVKVTCEDNSIVEDELSIKFFNPYYFGVTNKILNDITADDIAAMSKEVSEKGIKKHSYTSTNERTVFAYDRDYGLLQSILDINSFENISGFEYKEITIGTTVYYVWMSINSCYCSDFIYTFKF